MLKKIFPNICGIQVAKPFTYPACESLSTLSAHKRSGHEVGVMIASKMHVQELFLSKCFLTVAAGIWLFPSVGTFVHHHVTLLTEHKKMFVCFFKFPPTVKCMIVK